ncbi:MAG: type II toxin-antitoxin system VapC family toxin [Dermatophilaceae bacterium]
MIYIDTSALLRVIFPDDTTPALERYFDRDPALVSSALLQVEARRGTLRRAPLRLPQVDVVLSEVEVVEIGDAVIESAGRLSDPRLRSLDAIHLATALLVGEDVDALLTYDDRLADAAREHGLEVVSPT